MALPPAISTADGPTGSVYFENRNLFGGAESLRLEGDVFYAPPIFGIIANSFSGAQNFNNAGLGGRGTLVFIKPALYEPNFAQLICARLRKFRTAKPHKMNKAHRVKAPE